MDITAIIIAKLESLNKEICNPKNSYQVEAFIACWEKHDKWLRRVFLRRKEKENEYEEKSRKVIGVPVLG